jgi:DNA-binding NtrC family response regulator
MERHFNHRKGFRIVEPIEGAKALIKAMATQGKSFEKTERTERWSILVGAPDQALRERLASALRLQGHVVIEASDAHAMRERLAEVEGIPFDLIICGGVFAKSEDPDLVQKLASKQVTRALVLIPSGGFLSTATRARRLAADAVVTEPMNFEALWDVLKTASNLDQGSAPNVDGLALTQSS